MDIPSKLYHYTSQQGLLGILGNNSKPCIWMTDILYLNDSSELTHTLELVKSEIMERKDKLSSQGIPAYRADQQNLSTNDKIYDALELIETICDSFDNFQHDRFIENFVFSLSTNGDDLSQWRGYCPDGGYSIGFTTEKLLSIMKHSEDYELKECIYDLRSKDKEIKSIFDLVDTCCASDNNFVVSEIALATYVKIVFAAGFIKHDSFKSEQEYRIIFRGLNYDKKYRTGKSMIIPYMEFSPVDKHNLLPINEIVVGPTPHPELSRLSIERLFKSKGYTEVNVIKSAIPYRSW